MKRNKRKNKKKGFTLIEILVAVLIIGVISAIAVPSYMRSVERSKAVSPMTNLSAIARAQNSHKLATSHYTDNITNLDISLRDEESEDVAAGNTFESENFTYKVYGDDVAVATATRKTDDAEKQYELSVDYKTNQIYCRPIENKTCIDLGLEEGQDYSQYSQGSPCEGGAGDALAGEGFEAYMASMGANCRINNGVINYSYCEYNGRCEETKIEDGIMETCETSDVNEYNGIAYYNCERIDLSTWDTIDFKECVQFSPRGCEIWRGNNGCAIVGDSWECSEDYSFQVITEQDNVQTVMECDTFVINGVCQGNIVSISSTTTENGIETSYSCYGDSISGNTCSSYNQIRQEDPANNSYRFCKNIQGTDCSRWSMWYEYGVEYLE